MSCVSYLDTLANTNHGALSSVVRAHVAGEIRTLPGVFVGGKMIGTNPLTPMFNAIVWLLKGGALEGLTEFALTHDEFVSLRNDMVFMELYPIPQTYAELCEPFKLFGVEMRLMAA